MPTTLTWFAPLLHHPLDNTAQRSLAASRGPLPHAANPTRETTDEHSTPPTPRPFDRRTAPPQKDGAWCPWQQGVRTLFGVVDVLSAIAPKPAVDIGNHEPGDEVCTTIHKMKMT